MEETLQSRLRKSFAKFKGNIAIQCPAGCITYGELDGQSNYIANQLLSLGIAKETFIGLLMAHDHIPDLIVTIIGILKAGCVFIPLDPSYPTERLEQMIFSTDIGIIICDQKSPDRFNKRGVFTNDHRQVEFIRVENLLLKNRAVSGWIERKPDIRYNPEDKIYIYFTSGTTGVPKAILGKNKSLLHFIQWEIDTFAVDAGFKFSQFINPCFDAFLRDIFTPLFSGATICTPGNKEILLDPEKSVKWVDASGIHLVHCTPGIFRVLNSQVHAGGHFRELKFVLLSGERIEPSDLAGWYNTFGNRIRLVNLWGTSETTMAKTYYFIQPADVHLERIPVGKAMKGARVIILDNQMHVCDDMVVGEIYIRTPYRTLGYYKDPQANKERFIKNPFNDDPNDILHKTGDLGKFFHDGNLDVMGRVDRQVKIRGIRIELEEIESILLKHPRIKETVAMKKESSNGNTNEFLYAYVTANDSREMEYDKYRFISDIREYLAKKLPDYMIPTRIIILEKIPRKPNGKIDYHALPAPSAEENTPSTPPSNWIEHRILETWSKIFGIDSIGVTDNFFQLGGNSLNLMTLITSIHRELDIQISLAQIFNNPTIKQQAEIVKNSLKDIHPRIEPAEEKEYYELSPVQLRLYILHQAQPWSTTYNMTHAMVLAGQLEPGRLQTVFDKIIHRQASFRTSLQIIQGQVKQKIHREVEFEIEYDQVKEEEGTGRFAPLPTVPASALINSFIRSFDLSRVPLLRVGLFPMETEKNVLIIDMHHLISDGISLAILVEEFIALYKGETLPVLKICYKDYSEWQNTGTKKKVLKTQEDYWLKELHGDLPKLGLPIDFPRSPAQGFAGNSINNIIGKDETDRLKAMAKEERVTLFMLLLAICNVMLAKVSGQEDIIVGIPTANRDHPELQSIIGVFANHLVFRNYPQGTKTFREFLQEVKERTIQGFSNQDYSFAHLVERLALHRETNRNILFDVQFQMEDFNIPTVKIPNMKLEGYGLETTTAKLDLLLGFAEVGDILYFRVEYNIKLFKKETIERFIQYINAVLRTVLENPAQKLSEIEILSMVKKKEITARYDTDLEKELGWE